MLRSAAVCLTALGLTWVGWAQEGGKGGGDKPFLDVKGKIDGNDPQFKGRHYKLHKLKLAPGDYTIEMSSGDLDSIVVVQDSKEKILGIDDDGAGFPNARLLFKAPKEDEYRILAASFDNKFGDYHLVVRKSKAEDDPFFPVLNKPAPDFPISFSINGGAKRLSDLKGKVVVADFWAVWCGPCIATFPELIALDKDFKKDGLEVVGVTWYQKRFGFENGKLTKAEKPLTAEQEHAMLKDFVGHHKLTYQIVTVGDDAWGEASKAYRIGGIPHVAVIDRKGMVRMVRVGSGPENAEAIRSEVKRLLAEK